MAGGCRREFAISRQLVRYSRGRREHQERSWRSSGGGREIVEIVEIVEIALSSSKLTTNRPCSWYLVNGHEERERGKGVWVPTL